MGRGFLLRGFESHRTWGGGRCARALAHPSLPASGPLHALSPDAPQSLTHFRSDHAQIPMAVKSTHPHPTHPPSCRSFMEGSQEVKVTLSTEHPSPTLLLLRGPHDLRSQGQLHTELQHSQQNPTPPAATSAASSRLTRLRRPARVPSRRGRCCPPDLPMPPTRGGNAAPRSAQSRPPATWAAGAHVHSGFSTETHLSLCFRELLPPRTPAT